MTDPNMPADPYGEPPAGNPYGSSDAYGQPVGGAAYAGWPQRAGAALIDGLLLVPGYILYFIGISAGGGVGALFTVLGALVILGIFVWNTCLQGGNTGYTIGKGVLGIKLIGEQTGQPIGAGMAFARQIVHIVDSLPCYVGWLWPLWDAKRQTFADKILTTVVIVQPKG